jgi:hypothetical protein
VARGVRALAFVALCLLSLELTARLYWRLQGVPVTRPDRVLQAFYHGLSQVDTQDERWQSAMTRVLLLGGSTLHPRWGSVQAELREQLTFAGVPKLRIVNLAAPGLTSRDSRLAYEAIGDAERFDLVVVYDGLNEARANNAPPELFRDDYAHYGWYEIVNNLARHQGTARWSLPYTLEYLGLRMRQVVFSKRYVPRNRPRQDWIGYGATVRTTEPFAANLRAILARAARRGEPVLLMTFALRTPDGQSPTAFEARQFRYGPHRTPLELWGEPAQVRVAVTAHNEVIRSLAAASPDVRFVDQARLLDGDGRAFNDPCHLSLQGSHQFVANLLPAALEALHTRQAAREAGVIAR